MPLYARTQKKDLPNKIVIKADHYLEPSMEFISKKKAV